MSSTEPAIGPADPAAPDVATTIAAHVALMDELTDDPAACHRLDAGGLDTAHITLPAARYDHTVVAVGALADHTNDTPPWAEIKSMHVPAAHRGRGYSRRMLDALIELAVTKGEADIHLETATHFTAAIELYRSAGFIERGAFGNYPEHAESHFMTLSLC